MKKRFLSLSLLLAMLLACVVPAGHAISGSTALLDISKDTSMSYVVGKLYVTGSGGTAAGYNPAQTVYNGEQKVGYGEPRPQAVQSLINEAYNKVKSISDDLVSRGASGSIANPHTSSEETKKFDNRAKVTYKCLLDMGEIFFENQDDENDTKTTDELLAAFDFDSYSASIIRSMSPGESVQITYGEYGREMTYTVSAEGSVEGYSITVTNDGNGTGTASSSVALRDDEITLTAKPNSGYQFKEWQVISGGVTVANKRFTVGTANVEIKAIFEKAPDASDPDAGSNPDSGQQPPQQEQPPQDQQPDQPSEPQSDEKIVFSKLKKMKLKAVSKKKIKVSWKKLSKKVRKEVKQIEIQVSTDPEFRTILKTKLVKSSKTSYTISGLKKKTTYYVRIRAYNEKGGLKYVSEWVAKSKKTKKK